MSAPAKLWLRLAEAVAYPSERPEQTLAACLALLADSQAPGASASIAEFGREVAPLPLMTLQQMYVNTFDLDAGCSLDLGWHLVGDGPDRGAFLLFVREALMRAGISESEELPDHLTHLLLLVGHERDTGATATARLIAPAVERVASALAAAGSPYRHLLSAVHQLLVLAPETEEVRS